MLWGNGHPKAIQHVSINMIAGYAKGVSGNFGNARVVYDKFHIIHNVMKPCNQVRNAERRGAAGKRNLLERTPWMGLKSRVSWTEKEVQRWESMALGWCATGVAYERRLVLQGIYEWKGIRVARKLFVNWCAWVQAMREQTGKLFEPMAKTVQIIEGHLKGILSYWTRWLTTAFVEGRNNLFSPVKRKASG
jgi:transposase